MLAERVTPACPIAACCLRARTLLEGAVENANARRATAFDPIRGLYVTEREVAEILACMEPGALTLERPQPDWRLTALEPLTQNGYLHDVVALAVAAETIPRLERAFGFLHDDLTRRSLTEGLAIEILGIPPSAFERGSLLVALAIVEVTPAEIPLAAAIRIDRGFLATLRGERRLDARIRNYATFRPAKNGAQEPSAQAFAVEGGAFVPPLVLWGSAADDLKAETADALDRTGLAAVRLGAEASLEAAGIAAREAVLRASALVVESNDPLHARNVARFLEGLPVPAIVEAAAGIVDYDGRSQRVTRGVRPSGGGDRPAAYPLPYGRRILPRHSFCDLILPPQQLRAVRSVLGRLAQRETVLREWGLQTGSSIGGVRALFAGPPGTGKTLAAEALCSELGRDLYVVDVSLVVSKYIGETEKALARVFAEAARAGVCLFFDEADALFGKRTEAKDAHDRYANIETAYLLQALDAYPDLVILATNMAGNLDDALVRRIDVKVEFSMPDVAAREELWRRALARAPLAGVDLPELAKSLPLSGGGIQSTALAAAFEAAAAGRPIATIDLLRSARDEMAKLGRVAGRRELGDHFDTLRAERLV